MILVIDVFLTNKYSKPLTWEVTFMGTMIFINMNIDITILFYKLEKLY